MPEDVSCHFRTLGQLVNLVKDLPEFNTTTENADPNSARLDRLPILDPRMSDFTKLVRRHERILSKSKIYGACVIKNEWNRLAHQLRLARDASVFWSGGRQGRAVIWKGVQRKFAHWANSKLTSGQTKILVEIKRY